MPYFFDRDFFVSIVHLLTAGDVAARYVPVGAAFGIEVTLSDGSKVIWANTKATVWAFTRIFLTDDSLSSGQQAQFVSAVSWDSMPEVVAKMIATHDYGESSLVTTE